MRYDVMMATALLVAATGGRVMRAADRGLPVKDGRPAVALVNGEPITLDQFLLELDPGDDPAAVGRGTGTAAQLARLDRLVNVRLVVQDATSMGIREDPNIQKQVEVTGRAILRDVLLARVVKDVTADPAAVDAAFKELVKEWKTVSLLFQDEAAASRAREELVGGAAFADVAARAVAAGTARTDTDDQFHTRKEYLPPIADALATLPVGQVGPVLRLEAGWVVVVVTDIRYPDTAAARVEAGKQVLSRQQNAVLQEHDKTLRRRYVVVDTRLLNAIDYTAEKPGLEALRADRRVLATIKGAAPVTVADLTESLRMQSFHGTEASVDRKRMNANKEGALDATVGRRVLNMEALKLGLDKTTEYRDRVKAYEDGLVFDQFVQKVIVPDSKLTEDDVTQYYEQHVKDYSSPEMIRLRSIAFTARMPAEQAMKSLADGADFGWVMANADGQAPKGTEGLLSLDGRLITTDSMPEPLQKAVLGAKAGGYRLYATEEGRCYVLAIQDVVPPRAKPLAEVRDAIAKKVYGQKLTKNVEAYLARLRAASTIEMYLAEDR